MLWWKKRAIDRRWEPRGPIGPAHMALMLGFRGASHGRDLDRRLTLPPGWNFRAVVLEQDLVLTSDEGAVKITQDELGNTYDRVGGPYSAAWTARARRRTHIDTWACCRETLGPDTGQGWRAASGHWPWRGPGPAA